MTLKKCPYCGKNLEIRVVPMPAFPNLDPIPTCVNCNRGGELLEKVLQEEVPIAQT